MFGDLQSALKQDCASSQLPYTLMGTTGDQGSPHMPPVPVSVRATLLQLRFLNAEAEPSIYKPVVELRHFYTLRSSQMESERQKSLTASCLAPWEHPGINSLHDLQHHQLLDRVEQSLQLLQTKVHESKPLIKTHKSPPSTPRAEASGLSPPVTPTVTPSAPAPSGRRRLPTSPLNLLASRILNNWYERNQEHPYPSYETAEVMAKAGNISVEQVKKWFSNRRLREGNTKTLGQVAERRKRARTESSELFLGEGKRFRGFE